MDYLLLFALVIISYLIGSISFSRMISASRNVDITKQGSGNPGMTNVLRTHGFKLGLLALILDVLKGAVPSLIGVFAFGGYIDSGYPLVMTGTIQSYTALFTCGFASMIGHIFPIYYKFKGGKGVATFVGIFFVAQPIISAIAFVLAFISVLLFKLMSVTSICLTVIMTTIQIIFMPTKLLGEDVMTNIPIYIIVLVMAFLIIYSHRTNIVRLIHGNENITSLQDAIKKDKEQIKQDSKARQQEIKQDFKQVKQDYKQDNITKEVLKENKKEYKIQKQAIKQDKRTQLKTIRSDKKNQIKTIKRESKQDEKIDTENK